MTNPIRHASMQIDVSTDALFPYVAIAMSSYLLAFNLWQHMTISHPVYMESAPPRSRRKVPKTIPF